MAPPPTHDSIVSPCLHGCQAFLQRYSPLQSPPSHLRVSSSHSRQQTSPWDCFLIPSLQLPGTTCCRGLVSLYRVHRLLARIVCVALTQFRLSQISCCTLQQPQMLPLCPNNCPNVGIQTLLRQQLLSCSLSPFSLPSLILLNIVWIYIFLSDGRRLLPTLS